MENISTCILPSIRSRSALAWERSHMPQIYPVVDAQELAQVFAGMNLKRHKKKKPSMKSQRKWTLMTLPPEIRLLVYNHLTHQVALTSNGMITGSTRRCLLQADSLDAGVFMNTPIPHLQLICKQFSSEYSAHLRKRSGMLVMATRKIPPDLSALPWPQDSAARFRAFREVRSCRVFISWLSALGRGQPWESRAREWLRTMSPFLLQQLKGTDAWTPTRQVYQDLSRFIRSLYEDLAPDVVITFIIQVPSYEYRYTHKETSYMFDWIELSRMLARDPTRTQHTDLCIVLLTLTTPLFTAIKARDAYYARRKQAPGSKPARDEVGDSEYICTWGAKLVALRTGTWCQSDWLLEHIAYEGSYEG